MATRRDICVPRKKSDGGTYWVKIGTAWDNDGKTQLVFDSLPIPDADGRCVANLFEPKPQQGQQATHGRQQATQSQSWGDPLDDDLPPF